ncbi:hypothetical protein M427DRAFT_34472 [Gonapodya prolifera JEL478]|uniref:Uncharacterized protein n=1 Tax=Gonapodya prolifera (strain JEL478) TaxID=1344416 RepID=A0A139A7T0_GONPJ|nr:hypothetical protein M427DRAFT_34472 [Gonapodya prolifera JEL478]|eukprot:KXS12852.1 hypothetical protein M427DRAFT_34472 [Gonapodya prolifera JEL478]
MDSDSDESGVGFFDRSKEMARRKNASSALKGPVSKVKTGVGAPPSKPFGSPSDGAPARAVMEAIVDLTGASSDDQMDSRADYAQKQAKGGLATAKPKRRRKIVDGDSPLENGGEDLRLGSGGESDVPLAKRRKSSSFKNAGTGGRGDGDGSSDNDGDSDRPLAERIRGRAVEGRSASPESIDLVAEPRSSDDEDPDAGASGRESDSSSTKLERRSSSRVTRGSRRRGRGRGRGKGRGRGTTASKVVDSSDEYEIDEEAEAQGNRRCWKCKVYKMVTNKWRTGPEGPRSQTAKSQKKSDTVRESLRTDSAGTARKADSSSTAKMRHPIPPAPRASQSPSTTPSRNDPAHLSGRNSTQTAPTKNVLKDSQYKKPAQTVAPLKDALRDLPSFKKPRLESNTEPNPPAKSKSVPDAPVHPHRADLSHLTLIAPDLHPMYGLNHTIRLARERETGSVGEVRRWAGEHSQGNEWSTRQSPDRIMKVVEGVGWKAQMVGGQGPRVEEEIRVADDKEVGKGMTGADGIQVDRGMTIGRGMEGVRVGVETLESSEELVWRGKLQIPYSIQQGSGSVLQDAADGCFFDITAVAEEDTGDLQKVFSVAQPRSSVQSNTPKPLYQGTSRPQNPK